MTRRVLLPFLLLPLSACSLWVQYTQPETPVPQSWAEAPQDAAPQWPDKDWWAAFGATELTALIEEAHQANFDMKASVARVRQADAQARIAGGALLPAVNMSAGESRNQASRSRVGSTVNSTTPTVLTGDRRSNAINIGAKASYELDFWGKNSASEIAAESLAQASRFDAETVRMTVESSVANLYFDLLATKARLATAEQNYANAQELLNAIRLRFEQGIATELDLAQQENVAAAQNVAIAPLRLRLRQDQDAMAILLGKLPDAVAVPEANLLDIALPPVVAGLPSELLLRRPDVQNAEAQLIAANANITNARAQFFPSISLTGQLGYQSEKLSNLLSPNSLFWSFGSALAQPIFQGGALFGNLELTKAREEELLQNYHKAVIASFADVEDALAAVTQTAAQEKDQQTATDSARKAYQLAQQQFKGGITDITTVLNTQRVVFAAEDQLLTVRLAHLQAMVTLYNALGGGWQKSGDASKS